MVDVIVDRDVDGDAAVVASARHELRRRERCLTVAAAAAAVDLTFLGHQGVDALGDSDTFAALAFVAVGVELAAAAWADLVGLVEQVSDFGLGQLGLLGAGAAAALDLGLRRRLRLVLVWSPALLGFAPELLAISLRHALLQDLDLHR